MVAAMVLMDFSAPSAARRSGDLVTTTRDTKAVVLYRVAVNMMRLVDNNNLKIVLWDG